MNYRQAYDNGEPCGYVVQDGPANPICDVADESTAALFATASELLEFAEYMAEQCRTLAESDWSRGTLILNLADYALRAENLVTKAKRA